MRGSTSIYLTFLMLGMISVVTAADLATTEGEDPDLPPGMHEPVDEAEYIKQRDAFIALRRGVDPTRPADPAARMKANALMDDQFAIHCCWYIAITTTQAFYRGGGLGAETALIAANSRLCVECRCIGMTRGRHIRQRLRSQAHSAIGGN